jgi:hypothetical protein
MIISTRNLIFLLGSILLFALWDVDSGLAGHSSEQIINTDNLAIQLGPAEVVRGPDTISDNPFNTLLTNDSLLGYVGNSSTTGYLGGSLETLRALPAPVIDKGTGFDSCGAWLNSVWQDGAILRGWFHAETECPYPPTHKSVGYAESYDGGKTFVKPDYPANQVITSPYPYTGNDLDDEGDQRVIRVGNYLYMYFVAQRDWQVRVARSSIADGGRPGTWYKYNQGAFDQPGIAGNSSPIDPSGALTRSWISYNTQLKSYMGFSYIWRDYIIKDSHFAGFGFTFSPDGIHEWNSYPYLILSSEGEYWDRSTGSLELTEYPSMIGLYGDGENVGNSFWLYYMALNPGENFDRRYLIKRHVFIRETNSSQPIDLVPRIALSEYRKDSDTWFTTRQVTAGYQYNQTIGYLFTDQIENTMPVYDCYIDFWDDHMLVPGDQSCGGGNVKLLGRIGWIATKPFTNSIQIYRCFDEGATNHFVSTNPNCEGKRLEWSMGYLAQLSPIPSNQYVALSSYDNPNLQDTWVTTTTPSNTYTFDRRLGYLLNYSGYSSIPVYDCYLPNEMDHMLDIDPNCGNTSVLNLGQIGWIATQPFRESVAVYRCHDAVTYNHFASLNPDCNGKTLEWRIGYLATNPDIYYGKTIYLPIAMRFP